MVKFWIRKITKSYIKSLGELLPGSLPDGRQASRRKMFNLNSI